MHMHTLSLRRHGQLGAQGSRGPRLLGTVCHRVGMFLKELRVHTVAEDTAESASWRWSRLSLELVIAKHPSYFMISF